MKKDVIKPLRLIGLLAIAVLALTLLAPPLTAAPMDGVMMSGGKMMMMHAGKPTGPMDHEMTMSNGTEVSPDGTVKLKEGTLMHMKNGEMIMMDGHIMSGGKAMPMMNR